MIRELPIELDLPFQAGLSPDIEPARRHHLNWVRSHGLVRTEAGAHYHDACDMARMTGHCYPAARGATLDLLTDWMGWGFIFDDQLDGHLGRDPRAVAHIVDGIISVLCADPDDPIRPENAFERAAADLLRRFRAIMSPVWCHRFVAHMRDGLVGQVREVIRRFADEILDVEDLLGRGRRDALVEPLLDFVEVAIGIELAESLNGTTEFQAFRLAIVEASLLVNDVFSVDKESVLADMHNTVLVLEELHEQDRPDAMRQVKGLLSQRVRAIQAVQARLPRLFHSLALTEQERAHALAFVSGACTMLVGQHDAQVESPRYDPVAAGPCGGYDDLFPEHASGGSDR
jgi:avermitilol synthase